MYVLSAQDVVLICELLPNVYTALDLNPITRAIIDRSRDNLKVLVRRNHALNTLVDWGQSPLHIAVGWMQGLSILLSIGADPGFADQWGRLPLHYAIAKDCQPSAALLLSWNSPFTRVPSGPWFDDRTGSNNMFFGWWPDHLKRYPDHIVNQLVRRRSVFQEELINLLGSLYEVSMLPLSRGSVLDEWGIPLAVLTGAAASQWRGLWAAPTVYHLWESQTTPIRQTLFENGFHDINSYNSDGITPLMRACMDRSIGGMKWFMLRGCSPLGRDAWDQRNAFHIFAKSLQRPHFPDWRHAIPSFVASAASEKTQIKPSELYWTFLCHGLSNGFPDDWNCQTRAEKMRNILTDAYHPNPASVHGIQRCLIDPDGMTRVQQRKGVEILLKSRDSCQCLCAPGGCTGTTIALGREASGRQANLNPELTLKSWCAAFGNTHAITLVHRDYARFCVFEKLEMTHTCGSRPWPIRSIPKADRLEIQEEESELADRLEAFMKRYDDAFAAHEGSTMDFVEEWVERIHKDDAEYLWSLDVDAWRESLQETTEDESSDVKDQRDEHSEEEVDKAKEHDGTSRGAKQASTDENSPENTTTEERVNSRKKPGRRNSW